MGRRRQLTTVDFLKILKQLGRPENKSGATEMASVINLNKTGITRHR
jgi:hypothetical protein